MMQMKNVKRMAMVILLVLVLMMLGATAALASTGGGSLPWETPLDTLQKSISGPVATAMAIVAIVGCGLGIAFGEGGEGMKKLLWVVIGIAIAVLAGKVLTGLGLGAGLTF
jgi:type IV secretory pathway VirB2 component (pilin)